MIHGRRITRTDVLVLAVLAIVLVPGLATAQETGSRAEAQGTRLTLAEVYALARERNPRIAAAHSIALAVETREASAGLPPDPVLQIGVMNFRIPEFSTDMPTSMAPSIQAMQMFPFPGKLSLGREIAELSTTMARADAREAWWDVRTRASLAFYSIFSIDRQIEVMRKTLGLLEDFQQVAAAMYSAGTGRQSDVLRANVEVARIDAAITRMEAMRAVAVAKLNGVLDRPSDTPVGSPLLPALPLEIPHVEALRGLAEESRPLLDRARTGVEQARTRRSLARKQIWPNFSLGLQYGQRSGTHMGGAMVGFSLPVFAGSRQLRLREEAAAMERMASANLADIRARVDARVGELLADLAQARTLIALYRTDILPQAEANVESSFSSYRVGSVDFMTLVDAQMTVNRYEREYYALLGDYGAAIAGLEGTIGQEIPVTKALLAEVR